MKCATLPWGTFLAGFAAVALHGCVTDAPDIEPLPRVSDKYAPYDVVSIDSNRHQEELLEAAIGDISVSTPQFVPVQAQRSGNDRLSFGDMKNESNLRDQIRAANVGLSQIQYQAISAALGISIAGTQISASDAITGNIGGQADINWLDLLAGGDSSDGSNGAGDPKEDSNGEDTGNGNGNGRDGNGGGDDGNGDGSSNGSDGSDEGSSVQTNFGANRELSYKETFKSPEIPDVPEPSSVPAKVMDKLINLLGPSGTGYQLDPRKEASLIAAYKNYMIALEDYYNAETLYKSLQVFENGSTTQQWRPYRMLFSVTVDPGWHTYLHQMDAVIEMTLPGCDRHFRVLNVTPAETAQSIQELTSALQQYASSINVAGGFSAVAAQGALDQVTAAAERLEGLRKHTTSVVSYPDEQTVRLRIRPSIVPNAQRAEIQPTNILFAGTVLVNTKDKENAVCCDGLANLRFFEKRNESIVAYQNTLQELFRGSELLINRERDLILEDIEKLWRRLIGMGKTEFDLSRPEAVRVLRASRIGHLLEEIKDQFEETPINSMSSNDVSSQMNQIASGEEGLGDTTPDLRDSESALAEATLAYEAQFEQQLKLQLKRDGPLSPRLPFFHSPKEDEQRIFRILPDAQSKHGSHTLTSLIPRVAQPSPKEFGFVEDPVGFFAKAESNDDKYSAYIAYNVSNPPCQEGETAPEAKLTVYPDGNSADESINQVRKTGVLEIEDAPVHSGAPTTVFLELSRSCPDSGPEQVVHAVTLTPNTASPESQSDSKPTISIERAGISVDEMPVDAVPPEVLEALIGKQIITVKENGNGADKKESRAEESDKEESDNDDSENAESSGEAEPDVSVEAGNADSGEESPEKETP